MNPFDPSFIDVFFNGRPAPRSAPPAAKPAITLADLIDRGESLVRVGEKYYKIVVRAVEFTKA